MGEVELTVGGGKQALRRGDRYFIPKNGKHSGKRKAGYKDLTMFNQKDRYKVKQSP
jgi:quercetin dioxygenase-like cupin family protein